ncbi:MAG: phytoene/squalene synthase family protein [Candidatus Competibacteraceae bacterium]|jgi:phytoene synthase|nr:phytoene/squalene synthase family protein [Candidatus Competibacteraceae bacterium]
MTGTTALPPQAESQARLTLKRHGKSFYWAGTLLEPAQAQHAAVLYAFCRAADDLADGTDPSIARSGLSDIRQALERGVSADPTVSAFLQLATEQQLPLMPARVLIDTLIDDVGTVRLQTWDELLRYAYGVASTVGILMCGVLGVRDSAALPFAIDLGIAMQLTNISRDVLEDAARDRVYLPQEATSISLQPQYLVAGDGATRDAAYSVVEQVLRRANGYYRSADQGMRYLPWRARLAILTAARVYEAIGGVVQRRGDEYWRGRSYVGVAGKCWHTTRALSAALSQPGYWLSGKPPRHDPQLHQALRGLPGAQP